MPADRLIDQWGAAESTAWAAASQDAQLRGLEMHDLVGSSPLENGLALPPELIREIVTQSAHALSTYKPDARGQLAARQAIAPYHGKVTAEQVILTPGTSVAYLYAFRLLAGAGDEILCPWPTYPLFDDIASLAGVRVRRYHLHPPGTHGTHWTIDPHEIEFQVTPRTRAIVVVSPHNPTGSIATGPELEALANIARKHGFAIIFDEVFREFTHGEGFVPRPSDFDAPLTITLNGFSKMLSLPGLKAGWLVVEGDVDRGEQFLSACEYLSDTLLPVSELAQAAIAPMLNRAPELCAQLRSSLTARMREFVEGWRSAGLPVQVPEAGPYLCIPLPPRFHGRDEQLAVHLARKGYLLHAGAMYGIEEPHLVTTCIGAPPWPIDAIASEITAAGASI
jgi:aspartate/methionine/tyrosine aminotransferase